ncbi:hypothetical protein GP5015_2254 [gamma proteobacterium HTCC5015]|nr:hypothetical protein GP5015_2254 [gamma proteobacterium HTCC5015]
MKLRPIVLFYAALCTIVLLLCGCGNKGDLYLPQNDCKKAETPCNPS